MSIRDWFRTTGALRAELDRLRDEARRRITGLLQELEEAREECVLLEERRHRVEERLAQVVRERDRAWQALASERTQPIPAPTPVPADAALRAKLRREKERADALAARLDTLQQANMLADVPI